MVKNNYGKALLITVCIHFFGMASVHSQNTMGAKSLSMGQTGTALTESEWSLFSNVAMIPSQQNRVSFYGLRYAGLTEITDISTAVSLKSALGTLGAGIHRYGFDLFSETRLVVALKQSYGHIHAGGSLSYYHISQGGSYGSAGALGIHLGVAARISERVWVGARATNINQPSYARSEELLPRELAVGIHYRITETLLFTSDLVKDVLFPASVRTGLEVLLIGKLAARAGITTQPETVTFGFGYQTGSLQVNVGMQQHHQLGLSPALDIGLHF